MSPHHAPMCGSADMARNVWTLFLHLAGRGGESGQSTFSCAFLSFLVGITRIESVVQRNLLYLRDVTASCYDNPFGRYLQKHVVTFPSLCGKSGAKQVLTPRTTFSRKTFFRSPTRSLPGAKFHGDSSEPGLACAACTGPELFPEMCGRVLSPPHPHTA